MDKNRIQEIYSIIDTYQDHNVLSQWMFFTPGQRLTVGELKTLLRVYDLELHWGEAL